MSVVYTTVIMHSLPFMIALLNIIAPGILYIRITPAPAAFILEEEPLHLLPR